METVVFLNLRATSLNSQGYRTLRGKIAINIHETCRPDKKALKSWELVSYMGKNTKRTWKTILFKKNIHCKVKVVESINH